MAMTPEGASLPVNTAFSQAVPGLQLAWDSTSAKALLTCPRYYFYTIYQGWQPRILSVHLKFGLLYHGALERYDHARALGKDYEEAVRLAVRYCLEETWDRTPVGGRPWTSDLPEKTRFTLVRTVVWYLTQFEEDPLETVILSNGKPAVELSFRFQTDYSTWDGQPFLYCGHLDRLAICQDAAWVADNKTTKSALDAKFFSQFSPHFQFSGYTFGSKVVYHEPVKGLILNAAQVGATFSRFTRQHIHRDNDQLDEWYKDLGILMERAQQYADAHYWPMNTEACGNYGGCQFRDICGKSPKVRDQWLSSTFKRRVWDPLVARGDI